MIIQTVKLTPNGGYIVNGIISIPPDPANAYHQEVQAWIVAGNTPLPADVPTAEEIAKAEEIVQAPITARQWFAGQPAAVAFIRLTPAEQAAQIDLMTTTQLKTLLKFVTVAVAALVKRELL